MSEEWQTVKVNKNITNRNIKRADVIFHGVLENSAVVTTNLPYMNLTDCNAYAIKTKTT